MAGFSSASMPGCSSIRRVEGGDVPARRVATGDVAAWYRSDAIATVLVAPEKLGVYGRRLYHNIRLFEIRLHLQQQLLPLRLTRSCADHLYAVSNFTTRNTRMPFDPSESAKESCRWSLNLGLSLPIRSRSEASRRYCSI